jgi:uracil-DNA glycosylase family 4
MDWDYWGRPLPGLGDIDARFLIVGLAPAAHGGNRTGRMFTGDSSGDWVVRALYETGFANQPVSISRDDGLVVRDCYITAVARCAPPKNKPNRDELLNCRRYLVNEIYLLKNIRIILTLGRISFTNTLYALRELYPNLEYKNIIFSHGAKYFLVGTPYILYVSYHPSRQNTQTRRLTWDMWIDVYRRIREDLDRMASVSSG